MMDQLISVEIKERVAFSDIDMAQWAWHGAYPRFYENAREALLDEIGYGCRVTMKSGIYWAIVNYESSFRKPLYYKQDIIVNACLVDYKNGIKIKYLIRDAQTGEITSKASTVQLPVNAITKKMIYPIPPDLKLAIESYKLKRGLAND